MDAFPSWRSYWNFQWSVSRQFRFVRSPEIEQFLDTVLATSRDRETTLNEGAILWRSQLGHGWREEGEGDAAVEIPCAYPPSRMRPQRDRAPDGRANPRGIPCLYLTNRKETAIAEARPWIGSYVSVAQFKTSRALKIIDCSRGHNRQPLFLEEPGPDKRVEAVWAHIDRAFAEPMTRSDDSADYIPTQIIAELFKREGFDDVGYKSNFGEDGFNLALFDPHAAELINCGLYRVDRVHLDSSEQDNPYFIQKSSDTSE
jgi:RES domain